MQKEETYNPSLRWSEKAAGEKEDGSLHDASFYTLLRQPTERVDYLCFTLKNGRQHMVSASDITEMCHEPGSSIVLFFHAGTVHIEGRNLDALFGHLQDRRVKEVREFSDSRETVLNTDALFVSRIAFDSENLRRAGM